MPKDVDDIRKVVIETVEKQIKDENPPEVKETLIRLVSERYSAGTAKAYIGAALLMEIFLASQDNSEFDEVAFIERLELLPEPHSDDEDNPMVHLA